MLHETTLLISLLWRFQRLSVVALDAARRPPNKFSLKGNTMKTNDDCHTVCLQLARMSKRLATFLFLFTLPAWAAVPLVQNGGFETGNFSSWTQSGNLGSTAVTTGSQYVHSGTYGAELGPVGSLGFITQTPLATVTGESYLLSFWLENFGTTKTNEFSVAWDGTTIYDQTNLPAFGWSNYVFVVTANSTNSTLEFGLQNDPSFFGLDDINVAPLGIGLTFDTLPATVVPNGYGGLNWNDFSVLDGVHYANNPSGYGSGVVSTNNVAWSTGEASITNTTPFNLFSAYLTAAWSDNLQLETKGYANGVLIYDTTNFLNVTGPTLINFNYLGVTEVDFTTSGGTHHTGYYGSGVQFAMDNVNAATGPGVESNPQIAVPLPGSLSGQSAYVRSTIGEPWGSSDNDMAMNRVFGSNVWQDLRYETVSPAALFSPAMHFIFLEGSDDNANALNTFLTANLATLQTWVSNGGSLFINAAPNQGANINLGFGVTLNYGTQISTIGAAAIPVNPIFNGPFTPVGTNWTGDNFSHATVSGAGLAPLIININNGSIILGEINAGLGHVLFSGMTVPIFQSPEPQADNLRANILAYGNVNPQATFDDLPPSAGSPVPGGYHGLIWNNFDYLNGLNYSVNSNGYDAGVVSSSNVAFNAYGNPADVTSATGAHFNFISAELTSAWNDNLQVEAQGYVDGALTYDQTYTLSATTPTLIVFNYLGVTEVNFISSGGTTHAGYTGGGINFAMDNVSVGAVQPPVIQSITPSSGEIDLTWNAFVNVPYQVQYKTNLTQASWLNLGNIITGPGATATTFDIIGTNSMRFYRVGLLP